MNMSNLLVHGEVTGVGQYALNLLDGLQAIGELDRVELLVDKDSREVLQNRYPGVRISIVPDLPLGRFLPWKRDFFRIFFRDRVGVPLLLWRRKQGILFHPYNAMSVHVSRRHATVITLHDLFYKNFPQEHSRKLLCLLEACYRTIVYHSHRLIVPSQYVKDDIIRHFPGVRPDRIAPIHNSIRIRNDQMEPSGVPRPYVLSVNSLRVHKNILTLIRAFARIEDQVDHWLVLVGSGDPRGNDAVNRELRNLGVRKVVQTGYVSEAQRNDLYRNAALFVSPSLHEGFGMTPVEAALYGVPVLTTRETSLPEVTRELLEYYEPATDDVVLSRRMMEMLAQPPDQVRLDAIRSEYAKAYDYREVAGRYLAYFNALGTGQGSVQAGTGISGDRGEND